MTENHNDRILVVDDNDAIHADFRKLLTARENQVDNAALDALASDMFGESEAAPGSSVPTEVAYTLEHAHQGQEGVDRVREALERGRPFAVAFVDVRMPPGMDGIEAARQMLELDSELLIVICTAFADYSREEILGHLQHSDRYLILKKPFDGIEVQQLASTLTTRWRLERENRAQLDEIRAYASSLEAVNSALDADKRQVEGRTEEMARFLRDAGNCFSHAAEGLTDKIEQARRQGSGLVSRHLLEEANRRGRDLTDGLVEFAEYAALDAGDFRLDLERVDLVSILEAFSEHSLIRCEDAGLALACPSTASLPHEVEVDAARVVIALDAMVGWAAHHALGDSIDIDCEVRHSEIHGTSMLAFSVAFEAPQDLAEHREALLLPFIGDTAEVDEMALPLVNRLAQRFGGSLEMHFDRSGTTRLELRVDPGPLDIDAVRLLTWGRRRDAA